MYVSKIENSTVYKIIKLPFIENIQCFFIRSNTGRWSIDDWKSQSSDLFYSKAITVWGFSRIIRKDDPIFRKAAEKFGKDMDDDWELFGRWPPINRYASNKIKHVFGLRSIVSGFSTIPTKIIKQGDNSFISMINSSQFASDGFIIQQQSSQSDLSNLDVKLIQTHFTTIIEYRLKKYNSQKEWDSDLPLRENTLAKIIKHISDKNFITMIPVLNADVEVGFLVFTKDSRMFKENPKEDKKFPLYRLSRDWTIGLLR